MNSLAPMKNCPGGVQGNLNWMPGYDDSQILNRYYVLKNVILWKQRMHQITVTRVCICSGPELLVSAI